MKEKRNFFARIFAYTLLGITILVSIWSGLCYMASIVSPARLPIMGLLSLTTAFAFFANVFFVIFWLLTKKKWRGLIGVATLLVFSKIFLPVFGWNFFSSGNTVTNTDHKLKVMHWNVHAFGLYEANGAQQKAAEMEEVIKENNPDILCLAEYDVNGNDSMEPHTRRIMEENGFISYCFKKDNEFEADKNIHLGTAIFSKYPVKSFVTYPLDKRRQLIENGASYLLQTDVELPENKTLRVFALHLYSSGISNNDINFIEKLKGRKANGSAKPDYDEDFLYELNRRGINPNDHFRVFVFKLTLAFRRRAMEADSVARVINHSSYPVLICGDLNDVPSSYAYTTIRGRCKDAFVSKGKSLGRTFNAILPTLRIDDIFYDPALLKAAEYKTPFLFLSDHKPVVAIFEIKH